MYAVEHPELYKVNGESVLVNAGVKYNFKGPGADTMLLLSTIFTFGFPCMECGKGSEERESMELYDLAVDKICVIVSCDKCLEKCKSNIKTIKSNFQ